MILPVPGAEYDSGNEVQARRTIEQEDARNLKRSNGFWKPTLFGSTTAGAPTYIVQEGYWTRVDNTIIASFRVQISARGGMAGNLLLGGSLPVGSATPGSGAGGANGGGLISSVTGLTHQAGYTQWELQMRAGVAEAAIMEHGSGVASSNQTIANTADATTLTGTLIYQARV